MEFSSVFGDRTLATCAPWENPDIGRAADRKGLAAGDADAMLASDRGAA
jgi:hypothetical protein